MISYRKLLFWCCLITLVTGLAIGTIVTHSVTSKSLKRRHEKAMQAARDSARILQAQFDKIQFAGSLAAKELQITHQKDENLTLQARIKSDSIQHLSDLEAVRGINRYIKGKK
ncbi:hypothetical protein BWI93_10185 [Siphonobacter sp. BAB-5385]|uniref:hypothetical protein n=1 Tax=Siphonobacter sp. BAB-5385 TaxID=1864822 RepID=UPI000B9E86DB|nr:hypothetical protein [Siphonobacter sp. BAB-5385]OZI08226.1 hypothetical protein BWI93_10185 [Siphonobacter sp. BAB-5385]